MSFESRIKTLIDGAEVPENISPAALLEFLTENEVAQAGKSPAEADDTAAVNAIREAEETVSGEPPSDKTPSEAVSDELPQTEAEETQTEFIPKKRKKRRRGIARRVFYIICTLLVLAATGLSVYTKLVLKKEPEIPTFPNNFTAAVGYDEIYSALQTVYSEATRGFLGGECEAESLDIIADDDKRIYYLAKSSSTLYAVDKESSEVVFSEKLSGEPIGMYLYGGSLAVLSDIDGVITAELYSVSGNISAVADFSQCGNLRQFFFRDDKLYFLSDYDISHMALISADSPAEYIPYVSLDGEREYIAAEDILSPSEPLTPYYTVCTLLDIKSGEYMSTAVLGCTGGAYCGGDKLYTAVLGRYGEGIAEIDINSGEPTAYKELVGVRSIEEISGNITVITESGYAALSEGLVSLSIQGGEPERAAKPAGVPFTSTRFISAVSEESGGFRIAVKDEKSEEKFFVAVPDADSLAVEDERAIFADKNINIIAVPMYKKENWLYHSIVTFYVYDEYSGLTKKDELTVFSDGAEGILRRTLLSGDKIYLFSDTAVMTARQGDYKVISQTELK